MSHNTINNLTPQSGWFPESSHMGIPPHPSNFNVSGIHNFTSSSATVPQNNDPMSHVQPNTQGCPPYNAPRNNSFELQHSISSMNHTYGQTLNQHFNSHSNNNLNKFQPGLNYVEGQPPPGYSLPKENRSDFDTNTPPHMSFTFPQNSNSNSCFNNAPPVQPPQNNPQFSGRLPFRHPPPFNNNFQQFNQNCHPIHNLNNGQPQHGGSFPYEPRCSQPRMPFPVEKPFQQNVQRFNTPNVMLPPSQFSEPPPYSFHVPPPKSSSVILNNDNPHQKFLTTTVSDEKEMKLVSFLQRFHIDNQVKSKSSITVAEFRSSLQRAFLLSRMLQARRQKLESLLHNSEEEWGKEIEGITQIKSQLSAVCEMVSVPSNLSVIQRKLKLIRKKRELKQKLKQEASIMKLKKEQEREELSREVDKWLDTIKEKNLKEKREIEMKKEADCVLSEVRRKIQEAKKTIEKLKVLEKLRQVRQTNAEQKGLFSAEPQNSLFEAKVSQLRSLMQSQLHDYEGEERALKVMLEEEQGGRMEKEEEWRVQRGRNIQERRKRNIEKCLFGDAEDPSPEDPLFLFFRFHNSGNTSIENLVQIRHQWDVHLSDEGEAIPQQWVVPVPPSNPSWEDACSKD